jgi:peptidoglycan hydrolase CwlO-like protein
MPRGGDAMDLTPNFGGLATICVFIIGGWIAIKNSYNARFSRIEAEQASMRTALDQLSEDTRSVRDLSGQIAALSAKVDDLRADVSKHNSVIERTYKLESDSATAFHRIDELRDELHDFKAGGTA